MVNETNTQTGRQITAADLQNKDLTQLCFELVKPTYSNIQLPYAQSKIVDDKGIVTGYTDVMMQMFTKELQTANLDKADYEYCINTFNLAILLINHNVIGKTVVTHLEMINTRLLASNSKHGHLTKHMLSTIVNYKQKVEQTQEKNRNMFFPKKR